MTIEQRVQFHISVAIKLAEAGFGAKMLVDLDREPGSVPGQDGRGTSTDEMRNLFQHPAAQRGIDRRVVDLADEGRKSICVEDCHRPDDAICVWLAREREIAIRGQPEETGRSIAAFDAEKTLQRNAGISNIVLA
ncbi:hypothetical protein [Bradyrhizobium canariense]|uniref:hypothetical protein n=1 Tax=Bradyrhizobium canariense TaxID=255045 RepID=UPI001FE39E8B|nr:hypothetical protein [Bradyrhizobium canariense]